MPEIVNVYTQEVPALKFIGKKYGDEDRVGGSFASKWEEWHQNGWFSVVEQHGGGQEQLKSQYEDGEAYIGLMRWKEGEPFQYWIGLFAGQQCDVPEGFASVDFPLSTLGICWLRGTEPDIYAKEHLCAEKLAENGYKISADEEGAYWFFERYACSRFVHDENGVTTLDIGHYIRS